MQKASFTEVNFLNEAKSPLKFGATFGKTRLKFGAKHIKTRLKFGAKSFLIDEKNSKH